MGARGHFSKKATDRLSAEGLSLMNKGFAQKKASAQIAREVEAATGECVNPRTIGRRALEWRKAENRIREQKEKIQALMAAMDDGNLTASGAIKALALQALINDPDAFRQQNPLKVQSQNLRAEELIIKREALALKAREVAVNEGRLQLLQERENRMLAEVDQLKTKASEGRSITSDDIQRIREIYGLN